MPAHPIESLSLSAQVYGEEAGLVRWRKTLGEDYPAADYWLPREVQLLRIAASDPLTRTARTAPETVHTPPAPHRPVPQTPAATRAPEPIYSGVARPLQLDLESRALTVSAPGRRLSHWLTLPHTPFRYASELLNLILATLHLLERMEAQKLSRLGLSPDSLTLALNATGRIDYLSLTLIDLSLAHHANCPAEKPLPINPHGAYAHSLSPAFRTALRKDWSSFTLQMGEPEHQTWVELSSYAQAYYEQHSFPALAVNVLDWRADLYALGHWGEHIYQYHLDLAAIEQQMRAAGFNQKQQDEYLDALHEAIERMHKTARLGGFTTLRSCIKAMEALRLELPATVSELPTLSDTGTRAASSLLASFPAARDLPPREVGESHLPPSRTRRPGERLVLAGITVILLALILASLWRAGNWESGRGSGEAVHAASPQASSTLPAEGSVPDCGVASTLSTAAETRGTTPLASRLKEMTAADASAISPALPASAARPDAPLGRLPDRMPDTPLITLRELADAGNAAAQTELGYRYRRGTGVPQSNREAVVWYRKAATQDHAQAQAYLGFMHQAGLGVPQNFAEAFRYQKRAAEQGNATGQYNLGLLYLTGRGVAVDRIEAYRWLKKAAPGDSAARIQMEAVRRQLSPEELRKAETEG